MERLDLLLVNTMLNYTGNHGSSFSPIGCLMLQRAAEIAGVTTELLDFQLHYSNALIDIDALSVVILRYNPKWVGFSCVQETLPIAVLLSLKVKSLSKHIRVAIGGPGVSGVAQDVRATWPNLDLVAEGEGIVPLLRVMGVSPPYDTWPALNYARIQNTYSEAGLITATGCGFRCSFCAVQQRRKVKPKPILAEEIQSLSTNGKLVINFWDDEFLSRRIQAMDVIRLLHSVDPDFHWRCFARLDQLSSERLSELAKEGCELLYIGVESGDQETLDKIGKKFQVSSAPVALAAAKGNINTVFVSFLWGFPWESNLSFLKTLHLAAWAKTIGCVVQMNPVVPYPSAPLSTQYRSSLIYSEMMVRARFSGLLHRLNKETREALLEIVGANTAVFKCFCQFQCPDLDKKQAMIDSALN